MKNRIIPLVMTEDALSQGMSEATASELKQPLPIPPPAFIKVAGQSISEQAIAQEMQFHRSLNPHVSRLEAARTLVVRELLRLEAGRLALPVEPAANETEEEALIERLLSDQIQFATPSEEECRRYYANNGERLRTPDRIHVRHILLTAAPDDIDTRLEARTLGESLIAELQLHPERFIEKALRYSACPSSSEGGDLGWLERGGTVPELDRQLFMLNKGLAPMTLESRYGHHVVEILSLERGKPMTFEEAHLRIEAYLQAQTQQVAIHEYLQGLADHYGVEGLESFQQLAEAT